MQPHQAGQTGLRRFHIAFERGKVFDRFHILSFLDQLSHFRRFAFLFQLFGFGVHVVDFQSHELGHVVDHRQQPLGGQRFPVKGAGFLQNVVNNLAAFLKSDARLILLVLAEAVNHGNVKHVPGHFQIRTHAGVGVVDVAGVADDFRQAVDRRTAGADDAVFVSNQPAGIVVFERQGHRHVEVDRLFDFGRRADVHVLHVDVNTDGAVPIVIKDGFRTIPGRIGRTYGAVLPAGSREHNRNQQRYQ